MSPATTDTFIYWGTRALACIIWILPGWIAAGKGHRLAPALWAGCLALVPAAGWLAGWPGAAAAWSGLWVWAIALPRCRGMSWWALLNRPLGGRQ